MFASGEGVVPYTPRLRIPDNQVEWEKIFTAQNLNLMNSEETILESLEAFPELADAVSKHLNSMKNKKQANSNSQRGPNKENLWKGDKKKRRKIKRH